MSSNVTRPSTGSVELRARAKAQAYNSTLEQELFLARGETLAQWYAVAASPPVETEADRKRALLARLIRLMPDGLDADEQAEYIAQAQRRLGL
jgi:hypothetical protein